MYVHHSPKKWTSLFAAFDIVQSSKGNLDNYPKKIEYISEILKRFEYSHVVETHDYEADSIPNAFSSYGDRKS